uniref:Pirin-like protein n=1 Tax=Ananas comosus var. bracteatus TaxID=296719 RepID=A0A6V7QRT3_ANACO
MRISSSSSSSAITIYRRLLPFNPSSSYNNTPTTTTTTTTTAFLSPLCFTQKRFSSSSSDSVASPWPPSRSPVVARKLLAESQEEDTGAPVYVICRSELRSLDPFLLLDEFEVSPPAGFPDHPHRGWCSLNYFCGVSGLIHSSNFAGHKGTIGPGDVQWMTAGRGIVHSEMPAGEGVQKGLQLWINLSSKDKMIEPKYQELQSKDISRAEKDGVEVRIIAGEAFGVRSPVYTRTPTMYMDFTVNPGAQLQQPIPENWNSFVYIIEGEGIFGSEDSPPVTSHHCLVLGPGDGLNVWNKSGRPLRFVLVGGQPLDEPVVQHGPFVMNTRAEIRQAMEDYYLGRNGFEKAKQWKSDSLTH